VFPGVPENPARYVDSILSGGAAKLWFPSFVKRSDVFVLQERTVIGEKQLVCVVRKYDQTFLGVDAAGAIRQLSNDEFNSWPHVALSDVAPVEDRAAALANDSAPNGK
jgi:hypothetical protein